MYPDEHNVVPGSYELYLNLQEFNIVLFAFGTVTLWTVNIMTPFIW